MAQFRAQGLYGFEIQVQNPAAQPTDNVWALDFGLEAARPFDAIRIQWLGQVEAELSAPRTFLAEETSLELASTAASQFWWPNVEFSLPFRIVPSPPGGFSSPVLRSSGRIRRSQRRA